MILSEVHRVIVANPSAEKILGKLPHQDLGLLPGEFLDCIYSLANGCGHGLHCKQCSLRLAVVAAAAGHPREHLPVMHRGVSGDHRLTISTKKLGDLVQVFIHSISKL